MSTDTREALAALMVIAAECAQRKPLRGFEELTEATHIGHRQFGRAHEKADEDVRMLAVRLRAVFDTLAAALATQPAQPSAPIDAFELYAELRDLVAEAGAVDTLIGRPEVLRSRLADLCKRVGQLTTDLPLGTAQPSATQMPELYEAVERQIVGRFRVEKRSGGGFWPYCVKAGDGTMELFIGHKTKCEEVAQALQTACLDGAFMASKAAQPSAQGEAVELLKGWKLNHVQFVRGSGTAQIGWLDPEDDSFYPIVTVDTGLYYQPDAAVPLAQAIFDTLASAPAAPAQAVPLTDYEIAQMMNARSLQDGNDDSPWWLLFARDVERRASGIKAAP